jgi:hypothetical protein
LNGALTTRLAPGGKYAGINTLSTATFTKSKSPISDNSKIVFWGGASSKEPLDIKEAAF